MPSGPSLWPNLETSNRSRNDFLRSDLRSSSRNEGTTRHQSGANAAEEYYDLSRHRSSASAARTMTSRKGSPTDHDVSSEPAPSRPARKSVTDDTTPHKRTQSLLRHENISSGTKSKRLDFSSFFPRPRAAASRSLLSRKKLSRSPSMLTDVSESSTTDTAQAQDSGRRERYNDIHRVSADLKSTTRPKVFETDIFDGAKTHVRRPKKGSQNWFDSFDVSSDEEALSESTPQVLSADEDWAVGQAVPSGFSPWVKPENEQPVIARNASVDHTQEDLRAAEHAREVAQERIRAVQQRKCSFNSETIASHVSLEVPEKRRGGESRLASSRLANESVLSLSDSSEDESIYFSPTTENMDDKSIVADGDGPVPQPHDLSHIRRERLLRQSTSTVQTSGLIPIRLTTSIPLSVMSTSLDAGDRPTHSSHHDPTARALCKLNGVRDCSTPPSETRRTTGALPEEHESDTADRLPTDSSHMMAVTEDEKLLLESMRTRRAAMQHNSFAEGYRLALTQEQEHLARKREHAQQTVHDTFRQRQARSQRDSRIESVTEESSDSLDGQPNTYSALRRERVDNALKLERFFNAPETSLDDLFPVPPTNESFGEPRRTPQKSQLLLPNTYAPASCRGISDAASTGADPSPIPEDDDIEDHHRRIRRYLASSEAAERRSILPTPPLAIRSRSEPRPEKRNSWFSRSPVVEEEPIVPDSLDESEDGAPFPVQKEPQRISTSGRKLTSQNAPNLIVGTTPFAFLEPPAEATPSNDITDPYHLTPNIDFTPWDLSPNQAPDSPSMCTSRASPLTPPFLDCSTEEKAGAGSLEIAGSDNASLLSRRAYTPDSDPSFLSASTVGTNMIATTGGRKRPTATTKTIRKASDANDMLGLGLDVRSNNSSSTMSAGEDVLAAWAELGGGREALGSLRR